MDGENVSLPARIVSARTACCDCLSYGCDRVIGVRPRSFYLAGGEIALLEARSWSDPISTHVRCDCARPMSHVCRVESNLRCTMKFLCYSYAPKPSARAAGQQKMRE